VAAYIGSNAGSAARTRGSTPTSDSVSTSTPRARSLVTARAAGPATTVGEVLDDTDVFVAPEERPVGLVFQNPNVQLINQTVQSEVAFGPENLALPQPEIAARVDWCLDVTGMEGMRHAGVPTLSGGQKQRTAIAATLAMQPRILVLDEPLSDLDPVGAQEVLGTLRRLAREERTGIVIIEHRVDEVVPWADRVVLMHDGGVILDRPPRGAWDDQGPWTATGVGTPDVVRLAAALPDAFPGGAPLSAAVDVWGYIILVSLILGAFILNHLNIGARSYG